MQGRAVSLFPGAVSQCNLALLTDVHKLQIDKCTLLKRARTDPLGERKLLVGLALSTRT